MNSKKHAPLKKQLNSSGYDVSNFIRVKFPTIKSIKASSPGAKSHGTTLKVKQFVSSNNIAIVWDFDKTLTPVDSTSKVIEHFKGDGKDGQFWSMIKTIGQSGYKDKKDWEHVLASDAPTWMYSLSQLAYAHQKPLNKDFFKELVGDVSLYKNAEKFLKEIKALSETEDFKKLNISVHHFIVSAGLKEYIELIIPDKVFTWVWGCRYAVIIDEENDPQGDKPESVPVFCMDETMKTRAIFEIVKGTFLDTKNKQVNDRVETKDLWCNFENLIYIGDGPTDIPSLSLVRDRGGMGIVVYDESQTPNETKKRLGKMSAEKRCDLITPANYALSGELFKAIQSRCIQIQQKFAAENLKLDQLTRGKTPRLTSKHRG